MGFAFFAITAAALATAPVFSTPQLPSEVDTFDTTTIFSGNEETQNTIPTPAPKPIKKTPSRPFEAFTGKVTGSRVRVRLQPSLDGVILKELKQGEMVVVTGEVDDFYAVKPESECKGYIYRAYVLDNVVEANNVNVRIEPDSHAPILTQMGQGDAVVGVICPENCKWMRIDLPETIRFYMAKDYVTNIGDVTLYKRIQSRRQQLAARLETVETSVQNEMKRPFGDIQLVSYVNDLKTIIAQNQDLPELAEKAQALIKTIQEQYLQLSLGRPLDASKDAAQPATNEPSSSQVAALEPTVNLASEPMVAHRFSSFLLEQQEGNLLEQALRTGKAPSKELFYSDELKNAQELMGQLVPYERPVKNRPGDFMLVDTKTKVPMAYLYSCKIDLHQFSGQTLRLIVSPRPNHHFALPAYFVLDVNH